VTDVTPFVIGAVALAAFLIGVMKAGTGGGLGPLVTAILVTALPAGAALGLQLPLLIAGDFFALTALWKRWNLGLGLRLLGGALVGVVIGTLFLNVVSEDVIRRAVGVVALVFVATFFIEPRLRSLREYRPGTSAGVAAGTLSGVASTLAHAGGPPAAIYLILHRVKPVEFTSTMLLVFIVVNLVKVPAYFAAGLFDRSLMLSVLPALPLLPVGVWAGRWFVLHVDREVFDRLIVGLLFVTGVLLLVT